MSLKLELLCQSCKCLQVKTNDYLLLGWMKWQYDPVNTVGCLSHIVISKMNYSTLFLMDVDERLRLMLMKCRCQSCHFICDDVRFGEWRNAVPSIGHFGGGDSMFEEKTIIRKC